MENNMIGCKCSHLVEDGAKQGYNCFLYLRHHRQRLPTLWESKVTNVLVCVVSSLTGGEQGKTNCHSTVQRWRRSRGAHLERSLLLWLENFISFFYIQTQTSLLLVVEYGGHGTFGFWDHVSGVIVLFLFLTLIYHLVCWDLLCVVSEKQK